MQTPYQKTQDHVLKCKVCRQRLLADIERENAGKPSRPIQELLCGIGLALFNEAVREAAIDEGAKQLEAAVAAEVSH